MRIQATLGGYNLPWHFSYTPFVPEKRFNRRRTLGGVITQRLNPEFLIGDSTIQWSLNPANGAEAGLIYDLYMISGPLQFTGYWGDDLEISFDTFNQLQVRQNVWNLSGEFTVLCVNNQTSPDCVNPQNSG